MLLSVSVYKDLKNIEMAISGAEANPSMGRHSAAISGFVMTLLNARPVWWRATIWIDALLFGPYYAFAIYAFIRGRNWIRVPSIMFASIMLTNVTIILSEEIWGPSATPHLASVVGANASWIVAPLLVLWRMRREPFPRS